MGCGKASELYTVFESQVSCKVSAQLYLLITISVLSIAPTKSIEPYIDGTKSAPKVHMSRLVSDEKKKSANEIRKVVDPIMIKKKQDEVSDFLVMYMKLSIR